ncbi:hypothetical protein QP786_02410 [Gleimia europaea]|nr:hypothetical protein [Gleimia europaea]MDK8533078.1 hypothetical protein [Gleimia europaea]
MAGRGPRPKDPAQRARRNAEPSPFKVIEATPTRQPRLPVIYVPVELEDGTVKKKRFKWPEITKRWWRMWRESPLSTDYTDSDWSFLLDTAWIHAQYWLGDTKLAPELRLRVAKFGATPEDRARLRIVFATADEVEDKRSSKHSSAARSRSRVKELVVVGDEGALEAAR